MKNIKFYRETKRRCYVNNLNENKKIFIIGGEQLYKETENRGDKGAKGYTTKYIQCPKILNILPNSK